MKSYDFLVLGGGSAGFNAARVAASLGLRTATKPDSQDVCFITSTGGRHAFLGDRIPFKPGRMVVPRWRTMILPVLARSPAYSLTPKR